MIQKLRSNHTAAIFVPFIFYMYVFSYNVKTYMRSTSLHIV